MGLIEGDVIANGVRLHYYRTGGNKAPLVFAHGFTDSGLCWWPFAQQLTEQYEIILYDSRGHGKSEASNPTVNSRTRGEDLAGLVNALGLEKPALAGHSMGAVTVMLCAGLFPELPSRIVLEDPPPFELMAARSGEDTLRMEKWRELAEANRSKSAEELIVQNRIDCPIWPEIERAPWALSKQQISMTAFNEARQDPTEANQIVSRITCPSLLVTADVKLGAIYPSDKADQLAASLPAMKHVNIANAGHNIRREQPEAFLKAVKEFLLA